MATIRARTGTQQKRKKQPTPQRWKDLMAQMRQIRTAQGVTSRELVDKLGIDLKVLSAWETAHHAPHPHDWMMWLEALGLDVIIIDKAALDEANQATSDQ